MIAGRTRAGVWQHLEAFLRDFAGDLPEAKARALFAVQWPFHKALLTGKTTHAAWRSKPSWYAVSTEDRTINPDLERFMAKRMGAKTIEVKASHVSLISQPETIANLILEAAGLWRQPNPGSALMLLDLHVRTRNYSAPE